jgi:hypothetical protein
VTIKEIILCIIRKRLIRQRQREIADADKDDLGLRRIEEHRPPLLSQIFKTNPS